LDILRKLKSMDPGGRGLRKKGEKGRNRREKSPQKPKGSLHSKKSRRYRSERVKKIVELQGGFTQTWEREEKEGKGAGKEASQNKGFYPFWAGLSWRFARFIIWLMVRGEKKEGGG